MSYDVDGKIILRKKGPVPDSLLRPIRGYPLGADIALGTTKPTSASSRLMTA